MSDCKKPKDTLLFTWTLTHGSVGDLGPGHAIDYCEGKPNKLGRLLIKLGVSYSSLLMFESNFSKGDLLVLLLCALVVLLSKMGLHLEWTKHHENMFGVFLGAMIFATGVCALRLMIILREWHES